MLEAEQAIGATIDQSYLDWLGEFAPATFGRFTQLRDTLNELARCLSGFAPFYANRSLLFVEGWAEKAFLDKLKESHFSWYLDRIVECYDGKGNRRSKRISMLLRKYLSIGYTIYAQGDADGKLEEVFKGLIDAGDLKKENTFTFKHDFETSIPIPLLIRAMDLVGVEISFDAHNLQEIANTGDRSINVILREEFGIDLEPYKVPLATAVAEILVNTHHAWWQDEKFMNTELGKFLDFVHTIS